MESYAIYLPYALLLTGGAGTLWTLLRLLRRKATSWKLLLVGPMILLLLYPATVVTPPGHVAVIYSMVGGVQSAERPEGLSFVVPYVMSPTMMNVRTQGVRYVEGERGGIFAQTKDFLEVTTPITVVWHLDQAATAELFQNVGKGYAETIIRNALLQVAKAQIGDIDALDFARKRDDLALSIAAGLRLRLAPFGIIIEYVAVEDALFDEPFVTAVLNKEVADEVAETERRLVAKAEAKADQIVAEAEGARQAEVKRGEGVAEANRLIRASLTADLLTWQALAQWNGMLPSTYIGGSEIADLPGLLIEPR